MRLILVVEERGVAFRSLTEVVDTTSVHGSSSFSMIGSSAGNYALQLKSETICQLISTAELPDWSPPSITVGISSLEGLWRTSCRPSCFRESEFDHDPWSRVPQRNHDAMQIGDGFDAREA